MKIVLRRNTSACQSGPRYPLVESTFPSRMRKYHRRRAIIYSINKGKSNCLRDETRVQRASPAQIGKVASSIALTLAISCQPALSVTTDQLLFLEGWRAVDRAYVDKSFNGQNWLKLREQYLKKEPMGNREEAYAAVRKMLATLNDPFTRFLDPSRLSALRGGTKGSVVGVGVEVTYDESQGKDSELVVLTPLPGGPAESAGVMAGDVITAVNGVATRGLSLYEASDLLQGPEGSSADLVVRSRDSGEVRTLTLERLRVRINPVTYAACNNVSASVGPAGATDDGKLGYVRVATFSQNTVQGFRDALDALGQEGAARRLVLDLRNNGGGIFPAGVQLGQLLLDSGDIVYIADNQGVRDIYSAEGTAIEADAPLAVLVNKGTASASEVLAGALKDNGRAAIVGAEPTFGKGLIQTVVELSDGSGVAITVARYQTPAGTDINKVGIAPDIKLTPEQVPPMSGAAFCEAMQVPSAPHLFQ